MPRLKRMKGEKSAARQAGQAQIPSPRMRQGMQRQGDGQEGSIPMDGKGRAGGGTIGLADIKDVTSVKLHVAYLTVQAKCGVTLLPGHVASHVAQVH